MRLAVVLAAGLGCLPGCFGADQTMPGAGNRASAGLASKSPAVRTAMAAIRKLAGDVQALRPGTCVAHRAGLTPASKAAIIRQLLDAGFLDAAQQSKFPGGLMAGVFPPVADDGSECPKLPQPFEAAPGSTFGGHHSYPGGLPIHESFNLRSALNFADLYRTVYGAGPDRDALLAAPIWHDWAKAIVFQWNADGTEFEELAIAGTPAHHILGLAETIKRRLPARTILTQASAHAAPVMGGEGKVRDWLRAAGIIARMDPPALNGFRPEYSIHNLSDADFVVAVPAVAEAERILRELAGEFGYGEADRARYNVNYRNPALSYLTAERLMFLGLDRARAELRKLRASGVI